MLLSVLALMLATPSQAAETAREAILAQQGCYQVTFNYEEVEAHQDGYVLAPPKTSQIIEYIAVEEDSADRVVLQHILVTPPRIKHWKQIWSYEGRHFDVHSGPDQWSRQDLSEEEASGAWVQEVRGVADNPRYGCSAAWNLDEEGAWTCETWAPKPRRDKDREDYTVLLRTNTHRLREGGWDHEQRNTKLWVDGETQTPIVTEVGKNTYDRTDDAACEKAADWWERRSETWDQVQRAWDDVTKEHAHYEVQPRRGLLPLWIRLFWVARRAVRPARHHKIYARSVRHVERHITPLDETTTATSSSEE